MRYVKFIRVLKYVESTRSLTNYLELHKFPYLVSGMLLNDQEITFGKLSNGSEAA